MTLTPLNRPASPGCEHAPGVALQCHVRSQHMCTTQTQPSIHAHTYTHITHTHLFAECALQLDMVCSAEAERMKSFLFKTDPIECHIEGEVLQHTTALPTHYARLDTILDPIRHSILHCTRYYMSLVCVVLCCVCVFVCARCLNLVLVAEGARDDAWCGRRHRRGGVPRPPR